MDRVWRIVAAVKLPGSEQWQINRLIFNYDELRYWNAAIVIYDLVCGTWTDLSN